MLHRLLACLAFLTGLAAAGAPAHAEVASALSSHLEASANTAASKRDDVAEGRCALPGRFDSILAASVVPALEPIAPSRSVRIGSDRSRE